MSNIIIPSRQILPIGSPCFNREYLIYSTYLARRRVSIINPGLLMVRTSRTSLSYCAQVSDSKRLVTRTSHPRVLHTSHDTRGALFVSHSGRQSVTNRADPIRQGGALSSWSFINYIDSPSHIGLIIRSCLL